MSEVHEERAMQARILMDEPVYGPHVSRNRMKKVTVELRADGWLKTTIITVPADDPIEMRREINNSVRKFLRDNGKDEAFDWA